MDGSHLWWLQIAMPSLLLSCVDYLLGHRTLEAASLFVLGVEEELANRLYGRWCHFNEALSGRLLVGWFKRT